MTDQEKLAFEEWFKTSNIGRTEKHIALAAWEAGWGNRKNLSIDNSGLKNVFEGNLSNERSRPLVIKSIDKIIQEANNLYGIISKCPTGIYIDQSPLSQHISETKHSYFFVTHKDRSMLYTCSRCGQEFER